MSFNNRHEITSGTTSCTEWSMARMTKKGEKICGDFHLIQKSSNKILIAVVDGLGHGSEAAKASKTAIKTLRNYKNESLISLVNRCHNNLRSTRGVVMSLGLIDCRRRTLSWIGIGNVEGILLRKDPEKQHRPESIILRGGVVGYMLPSLQSSMIPVSNGDTLIFTTDGVRSYYASDVDVEDKPVEIVGHLAANYFKESDDALVLAVRLTED